MSPINAPAEALCEMATDVFKQPDRPHWSIASAILGRVNDEALYSTDYFGKYATLEAYAKDLLELTKGEVGLALKLWRLIGRSDPPIKFEAWAQVKRSRALLLIEVLDAGGEVSDWFMRMQFALTTLDFEMEVRHFLKEQVWTWFKIKVPLELLGVLEEALVRAASYVNLQTIEEANGSITPAQISVDLRYRFQCLEEIALHFLQTVEAPQMEIEEVTKAVGEGM